MWRRRAVGSIAIAATLVAGHSVAAAGAPLAVVAVPDVPAVPQPPQVNVPSAPTPSVPSPAPSAPTVPSVPTAPGVPSVAPGAGPGAVPGSPAGGSSSGSAGAGGGGGAGPAKSPGGSSGTGPNGDGPVSDRAGRARARGARGTRAGRGGALGDPTARPGTRARSQYEREMRRTVHALRGCLGSLPALEARVLSLRAGLAGQPLSRRATARRVELSTRSTARAERRGLRTLQGSCGRGRLGVALVDAGGGRPLTSHAAGFVQRMVGAARRGETQSLQGLIGAAFGVKGIRADSDPGDSRDRGPLWAAKLPADISGGDGGGLPMSFVLFGLTGLALIAWSLWPRKATGRAADGP